MTFLTRLKAETHALHMELEQALPLGRPGLTLPQYGAVLETFAAVVFPLEERLRQLAWNDAFEVEARWRSEALLQDLSSLELKLPAPASQFQTLTPLQGMGALYVLEGSRLGGAIIARDLARLGLNATHGAAFFSPSAHLAPDWKRFKEALTREVTEDEETEVVSGAQLTYQAFLSAWREKSKLDKVTE